MEELLCCVWMKWRWFKKELHLQAKTFQKHFKCEFQLFDIFFVLGKQNKASSDICIFFLFQLFSRSAA